MKTVPKISIIITYYNQKEEINIVLSSINNQGNGIKRECEIIIVDDGSDLKIDGNLLKEFYELNIKIITNSRNKGRAAARNKGALYARGNILIFVDGDRFLAPDFIEHHYRFHKMHNEPSVLVGNIAEVYCKDLNFLNKNIPDMFYNYKNIIRKYIYSYNYAYQVLKIYNDKGEAKCDFPWITLFSGNFSIRKENFWIDKGFDEGFVHWGYENIDFGYRLHGKGISFFHDKYALNFHIYHAQARGTIDGSNWIRNKYKDQKVIEKYFNYVEGLIPLNKIGKCENKVNLEKEYYEAKKMGPRFELPIYEKERKK